MFEVCVINTCVIVTDKSEQVNKGRFLPSLSQAIDCLKYTDTGLTADIVQFCLLWLPIACWEVMELYHVKM